TSNPAIRFIRVSPLSWLLSRGFQCGPARVTAVLQLFQSWLNAGSYWKMGICGPLRALCEHSETKKAAPVDAAFFPPARGRTVPRLLPGLWEVVAERGEYHVVGGLRPLTYAEAGCGQSSRCRAGAGIVPRPGILRDVGILNAPLDTALRPIVDLV